MINVKLAEKYCKDDITKIENYYNAINDTENIWELHHRLELTLDNDFANTKTDLIRFNMYYNRPYFELIFLSKTVHRQLHTKLNARSSDLMEKYRNNILGKNNSFYGKHHTEENKKLYSLQQKGIPKHNKVKELYKTQNINNLSWNEFQKWYKEKLK